VPLFIAGPSKKNYMKKNFFLSASFMIAVLCNTRGQTIKVPPGLDQWNIEFAEVTTETYMGKECIFLKKGAMFLKDVDLLDGIIEVDMSFPQQRSFPGFAFRMQDVENFENFYVRPHQSGNPDATQYTPVFNGQAGWQLYHGEGYSNAFTFKFNEWHHVKIVLNGLQADIFIDDMQKPLIKVAELKHEWKTGKIGLISGGTPVRFANLGYTPKQGTAPTRPPVPPNGTAGMITQWKVSNAVNRSFFENKNQLTDAIKKQLTWTTETSEPSGTINLSKFLQSGDTSNTIVAKVLIQSDAEQLKGLSFGFSDYVIIYLNDKAFYYGADKFMSRDYRFLGTIGFFDMIFLPLKKGLNELWFVVSEDFGGWGVKAKFENMENISLK
jgi:hypothetical protein